MDFAELARAFDAEVVWSAAGKSRTPLRFTIAEAAYLDGEGDTVLEDDVDQDIRDLDPENFEQATLTLNMQNSTPLGASVRLLITSDTSRADMFNFIELDPNREFLKESALGAANTDPVSGFVVTPENSTVELSLTREEFRILQNPPFKLAYQVVIDATPGEVAIRATDQIRISGLVRLSVMIKE